MWSASGDPYGDFGLMYVGGNKMKGPDAIIGPYTGKRYPAVTGRPGFYRDPDAPLCECKHLSERGVKNVDYKKMSGRI